MAKLLLLAVLAYLVYLGLESLMNRLRLPEPPRSPKPSAEPLVACARCGTYVLRSRVLAGRGGEAFCSESCRDRVSQDRSGAA